MCNCVTILTVPCIKPCSRVLCAETLRFIRKYANKMEQTSFPWKGDMFPLSLLQAATNTKSTLVIIN